MYICMISGNTISNVFMVVPPLIGMVYAIKDGFESRFIWCHFTLLSKYSCCSLNLTDVCACIINFNLTFPNIRI